MAKARKAAFGSEPCVVSHDDDEDQMKIDGHVCMYVCMYVVTYLKLDPCGQGQGGHKKREAKEPWEDIGLNLTELMTWQILV